MRLKAQELFQCLAGSDEKISATIERTFAPRELNDIYDISPTAVRRENRNLFRPERIFKIPLRKIDTFYFFFHSCDLLIYLYIHIENVYMCIIR